jgi:hypothetical protein
MDLTNDQKTAVEAWIQEGRSLADVQRALLEEFKISMTYMDVRFLVDDLDVAVVEPVIEEEEAKKEEAADEAQPAATADAELVDDGIGNGKGGQVVVDVDGVMLPGSLVSGTVKFSDGQSLGWQLSASGQLGLIPDENNPDYRPAPEDLEQFQSQLQEVLQQKGF